MIVSMYRLGTAFFLAFMLAAGSASAHVDMIALLAKVEKEYAAPKPLGRFRVTYSGPEAGKEPGLAVECDLVPRKRSGEGTGGSAAARLGVFLCRLLLNVLRLGQVDRAPLRLRPSSLVRPCGQALAADVGDV
jgi:hypothetical protein